MGTEESDDSTHYIIAAIDASFPQGGYETEPAWTEVAPGIEGVIKGAIRKILTVSPPS